jgi:hypothetical protein
VLSGNIDLQSDTIRVMLVGTGYTFAATHNVVNDVVGQELSGSGYSRKDLAGKSVTEDDTGNRAYFNATDVVWNNITTAKVGGVILFQFVTDDNDSRLIGAVLFGAWPTPDGGDLTIEWNDDGILETG